MSIYLLGVQILQAQHFFSFRHLLHTFCQSRKLYPANRSCCYDGKNDGDDDSNRPPSGQLPASPLNRNPYPGVSISGTMGVSGVMVVLVSLNPNGYTVKNALN
ncbi:hypothetical protein JYU12_00970 [bacterium AH-315-K03]|nr:hypothetical protein [bacterium AH-315-K03]